MTLDDDDIAMQLRCVHCLRLQDPLALLGVSHGHRPCARCGRSSQPMSRAAYQEVIRIRRLHDTP